MKHLAGIYADECVATVSISCQMHLSDARELGQDVSTVAPIVAQERFRDLSPHADSSAANRCDSAVTNRLCLTSSLRAWVFAKSDNFADHPIVSGRGWLKGERRVSPVAHPKVMESSLEGRFDASM